MISVPGTAINNHMLHDMVRMNHVPMANVLFFRHRHTEGQTVVTQNTQADTDRQTEI